MPFSLTILKLFLSAMAFISFKAISLFSFQPELINGTYEQTNMIAPKHSKVLMIWHGRNLDMANCFCLAC